ncbi:MAG: hypothetical protein JSW11_09495 [Candidatus Heimdallarchaeota archaeon]|nr:MAG: hypothetical protein JSW11_09495 [Candidatus Heimdallarchaeota archaeon]
MLKKILSYLLIIQMFSMVILWGIVALYFLVSGVALTGFSWLTFFSPNTYRISVLGERITEPSHIFFLFIISGCIIATIGIILFGFGFYVLKTIQIISIDLFREKAIVQN